jgi:hypothetical protein
MMMVVVLAELDRKAKSAATTMRPRSKRINSAFADDVTALTGADSMRRMGDDTSILESLCLSRYVNFPGIEFLFASRATGVGDPQAYMIVQYEPGLKNRSG